MLLHDNILDSIAGKAIALLKENNVAVPRSLCCLEPGDKTVFHIVGLRSRNAESLWRAGFRDIDALDRVSRVYHGSRQSPEMDLCHTTFENYSAKVAWFKSRGANVYQLQPFAFRTIENSVTPTTEVSGIAALHYIARCVGRNELAWTDHGLNELVKFGCRTWSRLFASSNVSIPMLRDIWTDPMRDSCRCACSGSGCLSFTHSVKAHHKYHLQGNACTLIYRMAMHLDIERTPEWVWLRSEMFRFRIFEEMKLRHTCCVTDLIGGNEWVIVELADEEDRREIRQEQEEQVGLLEVLVNEFEDKYQKLRVPLEEFFQEYFRKRMDEVLQERREVNLGELRRIGVEIHQDDGSVQDSAS